VADATDATDAHTPTRFVQITCPHCGNVKRVEARPAARRVCPRCRRQFADPLPR
jgi:ribosomal protein S27E